jgi:hypothetical protein
MYLWLPNALYLAIGVTVLFEVHTCTAPLCAGQIPAAEDGLGMKRNGFQCVQGRRVKRHGGHVSRAV